MLRAKFAYTAKHSDELSFEQGSEIVLLEKKENGWWRGDFQGAVGLFPYNYVEVLESTGVQASPRGGTFLVFCLAIIRCSISVHLLGLDMSHHFSVLILLLS